MPLGVYAGNNNAAGVSAFATATGAKITMAQSFLPWQAATGPYYGNLTGWGYLTTPTTLASWLSSWKGTACQMVFGVPMVCLDASGAPENTLATGAAGAQNANFTAIAQNLVAQGFGNAVLRLGWEFDGNWYPWKVQSAADATNFAAYWVQIVNTMRAVPGANFKFMWSLAGPAATFTAVTGAYPGASYVDYVGADPYDWSWNGSIFSGGNPNNACTVAQSNAVFNDLLTAPLGLNWLATFAKSVGKPIVIPEWAVTIRTDGHGLGDDPTFINNMCAWFKANNVAWVLYFIDTPTDNTNQGIDFLVTDGKFPNSLAALKANFASVAPPASKSFPIGVGVNGGSLVYVRANDPINATAFAQMKALGAKYVRISVPWNYNPPYASWPTFFNADGSYNPVVASEANAIKTLASSYGLTVLFLIDGLVSMTAEPPNNAAYKAGLPYTPQAYAAAAAWFVSQVKGAHVELINEPDQYQFSYNANFPFTPATYAQMLQLTYPAMKKADPTCFVHMGPVANINQGGQSGYAFRVALKTALPNYSDFIDFDGWHIYTWPDNNTVASIAGQNAAAILAWGVTKPWWSSELGKKSVSTNSGNGLPEMTPALQATYLVDELKALAAETTPPKVVFIFCLADFNGGPWGLFDSTGGGDSDNNAKPAYAAIQSLIKGGV